MPRIPPTPGLIGYDFGYKPAIFLAVPPRRNAVMNQQTDEDDSGPPSCYSTYLDVIRGVISGMALCGCFSTVISGVTRYFTPSNLLGVNGSFNAIADVPDTSNTVWSTVVGSITLQEVTGSTVRPIDICDGDPIDDPFDANVLLVINCAPDHDFQLQAFMALSVDLGSASQAFASTDFSPETWFSPGDVVTNVVTCTLDGVNYYNNALAGGQLTVL